MTDYSSTTGGPRSPLFGTATFSTLSATQTPLSPSRLSTSSARSLTPTPTASYDSDDASSNGQMRRIIVSRSPSSRDSYSDTYTEDDSDIAASFAQLDAEVDSALQSWTAHSPSSQTFAEELESPAQISGDYYSPATAFLERGRILSTISEHTENISSRPTSFAQSGGAPGSRPITQISTSSGDANRGSAHGDLGPSTSAHVRSATEPAQLQSQRAHTPGPKPPAGPRVGEKVAFFEQRSGATSPFIRSHSRTASAPSGPRPQSSLGTTTQSQSMPTISTFTSTGYGASTGYMTSTGYGSGTGYSTSRPSSPTKNSSWETSALSPKPQSSSTSSEDSRVTPTSHTYSRSLGGTSSYTGTDTYTPSGTYTRTYTGSVTNTDTLTHTYGASSETITQTASSLRRPQTSPRSPLTAVRSIMQRWRDQTPNLAKSTRSTTTPSPEGPGLRRGPRRPRDRVIDSARRPSRIGNLWYLNVHASPPYRWQRCQALLYPRMLLLTWIAPGGGRGVVTLDLLNCTEVGSTRSPSDPRTVDDVGTQAAKEQNYADVDLMTLLLPFHLLYSDGVERLAAESPGERARWVEAIWEILNRSVSIPDRSATQSPTGSIRTIRTIDSGTSSRSGSGSGSTSVQFFRLSAIPDMSDLHSLSGSSTLSRRPSLISTQNTRTLDDSALSGSSYLLPSGAGVIGPARTRSLRRTSSLTDLGEDIESAARQARESRGGLGFGLGLVGLPLGDGAPVTVSSGPRLHGDVRLTPPPRSRASSRTRGSSETSTSLTDDAFFSAGSGSGTTRTPTSSYYSSSSFTRGLLSTADYTTSRSGTGLATDETIVDITSGTGTNIVTSTLSYRGTASNSLLGDSHTGSSPYSSITPTSSRTSLTRSGGVRRRTRGSFTTSYLSGSEETSDKENSDSYAYSGTRSYTDSRYPSELSTLEGYSYSASRSATPTPTDLSSSRTTSHTEESVPESMPEEQPMSSTSSEYVTAKSPSGSLASLPTIPSLSDYETAEVCSTEYETAEICPTTPSVTEFKTAEVCPTEPGSEYVTAEVCPTEASTEYETAECRCQKIPASPEPIDREVDVVSIHPSEIPTIRSRTPSIVEESVSLSPAMIPLPVSSPPTSYSSSEVSDIELSSEEPVPSPSPEPTPSVSLTSPSETETIPGPSPIPSPLPELSLTPLESISTPTESSVTPPSSDVSLTVPTSIRQSTPSSPSLLGSTWGNETDESYESSLLQASPSIQSITFPDPPDVSFETSGLRPSPSVESESEPELTLMTPASEVSTPSESIPTSPTSPSSESVTPTPSTLSLPPSVPSPTPVSSEKSQVTLTRTPSSISTVSSVSMSSSVFYPRSLFEMPLDDISTEPSLLSTAASPSSVALPIPPFSPRDIALPPSPAPSTPSVSMSVSITTPRGDIPSIRTSLETIPSEASAPILPTGPSHILTHDVNVLLQHLHELEETRGPQIREIVENVRVIRENVAELVEDKRTRGVQEEDVPPPVPLKDSAVGGSSELSSLKSFGPRALAPSPRPPMQPRLVPIPVTPPPMRSRMSSPDTLTETMSFLSSHHSDDFSLLESESYPGQAASPPWSSPSSSPSSSPTSSSVSIPPLPESESISSISPESALSYEDIRNIPPPHSPTPSSSSSATARPIPPPDISRLRESLQGVQQQVAALWEGQGSTNRMLDDLLQRPSGPSGPDPETQDRLHRIEDIVHRILEQLSVPRPEPPRAAPPPAPRDDVSEAYTSSGTDVSSFIDRLREAVRTGAGDEPPQIHMPRPMHAGPSFNEMLAQTLATEPPPPPAPVELPPPLVTLQYRPGARATRPRSASPTFETTLPDRARTVPITRPVIFREDRARPQRRRPPARRPAPPPSETESMGYIPPVVPTTPAARTRTPGPLDNGDDIDMEREIRARRQQRRPDQPDGVYRPGGATPPAQPVRPPTAPADLGGEDDQRRGPQAWYTPRREDQPTTMGDMPGSQPGQTAVPPPGTFTVLPTAGPSQPPPVPPQAQPAQPAPTILQLPPTFDDIVALLRENRFAHVATIDQQREIMRYLRSLNEWLERDVHDRQSEIRGVNARLDNLTDHFNDMMGGRPPAATPGTAPATVVVPPGQVPPPPVILQQGQQLPPGFQPTPGPGVRPPGTPFRTERTPTPDFPPVFPGRRSSSDIVIPPPPGEMPIPVIPEMPAVYPPQPQQRPPPQVYREPSPVIPPTPSSSSSSSGMYTDQGREHVTGEHIMVIPPPQGGPGDTVAVIPPPQPTVVRMSPSGGRSRSGSPLSGRSYHSRRDYSPRSSRSGSPHIIHLPPSQVQADAGGAVPIPAPGTPQPPQQPTVIVTGQPGAPVAPAAPGAVPHPAIIVQPPPQSFSSHGVPSHSVPVSDVSRSPQPTPVVIRESDHPATTVIHHTHSRSPSPGRGDYHDRSRRPSQRSHRDHSRRSSRSSPPRHDIRIRTSRSRSRSPSSRSSRRTPPPIVIPGQQPGYPGQPITVAPPMMGQPGMMPAPMMGPPPTFLPTIPPQVVTIPRSRSRSRSSGRRTPFIVQGAPHPSQMYEGRPSRRSRSPRSRSRSRSPTRVVEIGRSEGRSRHTHSPTRLPTVPPATVIVPTSRTHDRGRSRTRSRSRSRSPSRRDYDRGHRRRGRRHRSRSYSPSRSYSGERDPRDRRRRRERRPSYSDRSYSPSRHVRQPSRRYSPSPRRRSQSLEYEPSRRTHRSHRSGSGVQPTVVVHRSPSRSPVLIAGPSTRRTRSSRRPRSAVSVREHDGARSPQVIHVQGHPSRSPTLIEEVQRSPTHITRIPTGRSGRTVVTRHSPSPESESPSPRIHPARTHRTGSPLYSDHDAGGSRSPPPVVVRSPSRRSPVRRQGSTRVPTIIPIERTHVPSEGMSISPSRGRRPSQVTEHHYEEELTPGHATTHVSEPQSRVSSLERAFSQSDAPGVIPARPSRTRPPTSPRTSLRQQLHEAPPDAPTIPYMPTHVEEEEIIPVPEPVPHVETTVLPHAVPPTPAPADTYPIPPPQGPSPGEMRELRELPVTAVPHAPTRFDDLALADAERERTERFDDMEKQLVEVVQHAEEGEQRREDTFQHNEDERERLFLEQEARRHAEAKQRGEELVRTLEDRLATLPVPIPVSAPHVDVGEEAGRTPSVHVAEIPPSERSPAPSRASSLRTASLHDVDAERRTLVEATSRYSQELRDTIAAEREEATRQLEAERAERERRDAELAVERQRIEEEHQAHIRLLEEQIAAMQTEKEERQARELEEAQRHENERAEDIERSENQAQQLAEISNIVSEQRDECIQKRELQDERWIQKQNRRQEKDAMWMNMRDMITQLLQEKEECKAREDERMQMLIGAMREMQNQTMGALATLKGEISDSMRAMADECREKLDQQTQIILDASEASAQKQVPFNVQGYLDDFSKSLASEVRLLIGEVGKLHERKRTLNYQIGTFMCLQAQIGPGGILDPDWVPENYVQPEPPAAEPVPEPEPMAPAPSAWRYIPGRNRLRRVRTASRPHQAPPSAPGQPQVPYPGAQPRPGASWQSEMWRPTHLEQITPPQVTPTLLTPQQPSPGLFGPRTPSGSIHQS
ncbi:unnamed protein product [Somion occarium]|uniref:PH domain-containing protein n=1 Tax=Somion occarium TaxID=3059160 RepID=A0ABP1DS96_9APHY